MYKPRYAHNKRQRKLETLPGMRSFGKRAILVAPLAAGSAAAGLAYKHSADEEGGLLQQKEEVADNFAATSARNSAYRSLNVDTESAERYLDLLRSGDAAPEAIEEMRQQVARDNPGSLSQITLDAFRAASQMSSIDRQAGQVRHDRLPDVAEAFVSTSTSLYVSLAFFAACIGRVRSGRLHGRFTEAKQAKAQMKKGKPECPEQADPAAAPNRPVSFMPRKHEEDGQSGLEQERRRNGKPGARAWQQHVEGAPASNAKNGRPSPVPSNGCASLDDAIESLVFPAAAVQAIVDSGLRADDVRKVLVRGLRLNSGKGATGAKYFNITAFRANVRRISNGDRLEEKLGGIESFLYRNGVVYYYKCGDVIGLNIKSGRRRKIVDSCEPTVAGEQILHAVLDWMRKMHGR